MQHFQLYAQKCYFLSKQNDHSNYFTHIPLTCIHKITDCNYNYIVANPATVHLYNISPLFLQPITLNSDLNDNFSFLRIK